jgi:hypothetical protein
LKNLDGEAIQERAEALRPGRTCVVDIPLDGTALAGAYNVHVGIKFNDGKEWLMRTPYNDGPMPPREVLERIYKSEALTLTVLGDHGIPVPAVYECGVGPLSKKKGEYYCLQCASVACADVDRFIGRIHLF